MYVLWMFPCEKDISVELFKHCSQQAKAILLYMDAIIQQETKSESKSKIFSR